MTAGNRDDIPIDLVCPAAVVLEHLRDTQCLAAAIAQRLAGRERFELRENITALVHEISEPMQKNGAIIRGQLRPAAFAKGFARGFYSAINIAFVARRSRSMPPPPPPEEDRPSP